MLSEQLFIFYWRILGFSSRRLLFQYDGKLLQKWNQLDRTFFPPLQDKKKHNLKIVVSLGFPVR